MVWVGQKLISKRIYRRMRLSEEDPLPAGRAGLLLVQPKRRRQLRNMMMMEKRGSR
jgi:hypothetical protein